MEKNELKPAGVFHYFDEICQSAASFEEGRENELLI